MIKTIRTKDIYDTIKSITGISSLVTVLNQKPSEKYVNTTLANTSYLYLSKITDNTSNTSNS
jgi:hypothetical protein